MVYNVLMEKKTSKAYSNMGLEIEPTPPKDNVAYIDEYPELAKRVWLRRLAQERLVGSKAICEVFVLPEPPDGAA